MRNEIKSKDIKIEECNTLISKIDPLEEKLRIFENIIESNKESSKNYSL